MLVIFMWLLFEVGLLLGCVVKKCGNESGNENDDFIENKFD